MARHFSEEVEHAIGEAKALVRRGFPWWLRPFLMRNVVAITLGRRIYLSASAGDHAIDSLLRHELTHVRQVNRLGLMPFYWRYAVEFARNLRSGMSLDGAYRHISFEEEAFAAEAETYNRGSGTAG